MRVKRQDVKIIRGLSPACKIAKIARVCTGTEGKAEATAEDALPFLEKLQKMGHGSVFEHARIKVDRQEFLKHIVPYAPTFCYGFESRIVRRDEYYMMNVRDYLASGGRLQSIVDHEEADDYLTARFFIDIGISRELIRHRSMSFMERSTRWCGWREEEDGVEFIIPEAALFEWSDEMQIEFQHTCATAEKHYFTLLKQGAKKQEARLALPLCTATTLYVSGTYDKWIDLLKLRLGTRAHPQMRSIMRKLINLPEFPEHVKQLALREAEK